MAELRKQLRILEDKNRSYMQQTLELEDELRKCLSFKTQVESYKKQVTAGLAALPYFCWNRWTGALQVCGLIDD